MALTRQVPRARMGDAWVANFHAALRRVGKTPEDRLRWLLDFVQKDLAGANDADLGQVEDELGALTFSMGFSSPDALVQPTVELGRKRLLSLRDELRRGAENVLRLARAWIVDGSNIQL